MVSRSRILRCPVEGGEITGRVIEPGSWKGEGGVKGAEGKSGRAVYVNIHRGGCVGWDLIDSGIRTKKRYIQEKVGLKKGVLHSTRATDH